MKNEVIDNVCDLDELLFEPNVFRIVNYTDAVVASYFQTHPDIQFRPADSSYGQFTETELTEQLSIYPNPFSESFTIRHTDEPIYLEIINMDGKVRHIERLGSGTSSTIHTDHLPSGMYLIKIVQNGKLYNHKLVKQ